MRLLRSLAAGDSHHNLRRAFSIFPANARAMHSLA
jgi:hypothetical protein